jgi:hypothetical protein
MTIAEDASPDPDAERRWEDAVRKALAKGKPPPRKAKKAAEKPGKAKSAEKKRAK